MKIDLFATTCFEQRTDSFGIYDDSSFPTESAQLVSFNDGTAKVENANSYSVYFVPLDKNIVCLRADGNQESQCDAVLICIRPENNYDFYFVELKEANKTMSWIPDGAKQLKTTILNFKGNYNLSCLSKKAAFLANKSHPCYHYNQQELMERFRNETGFRLNICATITVK
ncbi:MAG: hypothetical protein LBU22_05880 [Dysgonamonadaceae bacterium]|jgi:hypothetical protein|nr:hypothetical protein [Dysgonamonadaceae bacterium]